MENLSPLQIKTVFLLENLKPERLTRVVDVGANPLEEPAYMELFKLGGCEIWGFEPQPEAFKQLQENPAPRAHYLPYAIGDGSKTKLNIYASSGFTSTLSINPLLYEGLGLFPAVRTPIEQIDLETKRLDDMEDLPEFDLLKIDIQGGETKVFDNASRHLSKAVAVITEVAAIPLYTDQPLLDAQMRSLRQYGYDLHKFLFFKQITRKTRATKSLHRRRSRNQLLDGDAVFLRGLLDFRQLNSQELRHQLLLADSVYESYDLALHLLQELIGRREVPKNLLTDYLNLLRPLGILNE